ncbi:MAG TPA: ABC transporter ATP-binding protein [Phycisphaerales bacterium]|nr:ABC transporter ATP-binding protein [Phycisphaerales bacterium]
MITITGLHKSFGSIKAVDGLALTVQAGECFGLLGPNGAGKTTTISIATGLLAPDQGSVVIGREGTGGDPRSPRVRRLIGVAPQSLALYDDLSAEENLRFFGAVYDLRGRDLAERVSGVLDTVQLADRRRHRVSGFSGGMKRRLNLAAALLHNPRVVFMDEPTAGVDPQSRVAIFGIVDRLKRDGTTVVYSTHYMEEAERICDRVAIVDRGRLLALDTVRGLTEAHGGLSTVVIHRRGADLPERIETRQPVQALASAVNAGGVDTASIKAPNLESVFLSLTGRTIRD